MRNISISCLETRPSHIEQAATAVQRTAGCIKVDCVYWLSNTVFPRVIPGVEVVNITVPAFRDVHQDISTVCLRVVPRVVATDFTIVVQSDGFAVNPEAWDDAFFKYDYIGATWPWMWGGNSLKRRPIVGNGGFSWRSRKLYRALLDIGVTWRLEDWAHDRRIDLPEYFVADTQGNKRIPEDVLISLWYRERLEREYGIRFCPPQLANRFSVEFVSRYTQEWLGRSFGFHGIVAAPYYGVTL